MTRTRFIRAVDRFHQGEDAQISFLAIAGFICFVALLAMVINTNDVVSERVHVQDVADITALSTASWTARGLNLVSFINVLNSKLIATSVLLNALDDALPVIIAMGEIQYAIFQGCTGVPFIGVFCAAMAVIVRVQLTVLRPLSRAVKSAAKKLSVCGGGGSGFLWTMMAGLEKVAGGIKTTFVVIGMAEGLAIAKANGGYTGTALSGAFSQEGLTLPVDTTGKFEDFCPYVMDGGPGYELQDYACKTGPLKLGRSRIKETLLKPFINLASHPIFHGMVMARNAEIGCKNDASDSNLIPVELKDLTQCKKYKSTASWAQLFGETSVVKERLRKEDFVPWSPWKPHEDDGSKGEKEATDKVDISDIGGILPGKRDAEDAIQDQNKKPDGKGNNFGVRERKVTLYEKSCDGSPYPPYSRRSGGVGGVTTPDFLPGTMYCTVCNSIDKNDEFTWYSADHVEGGAEDAGGYFLRVKEVEVPGDEPGYIYYVETVSLVSAGTKDMTPKQFDDYTKAELKKIDKDVDTKKNAGSKDCKKPEPWLLTKGTTTKELEDFHNQLRFIAVVQKKMDPPFFSKFFNTPPSRSIAYSQAQVYNYLSEDAFTQDWRVRLEPATLLEKRQLALAPSRP